MIENNMYTREFIKTELKKPSTVNQRKLVKLCVKKIFNAHRYPKCPTG